MALSSFGYSLVGHDQQQHFVRVDSGVLPGVKALNREHLDACGELVVEDLAGDPLGVLGRGHRRQHDRVGRRHLSQISHRRAGSLPESVPTSCGSRPRRSACLSPGSPGARGRRLQQRTVRVEEPRHLPPVCRDDHRSRTPNRRLRTTGADPSGRTKGDLVQERVLVAVRDRPEGQPIEHRPERPRLGAVEADGDRTRSGNGRAGLREPGHLGDAGGGSKLSR